MVQWILCQRDTGTGMFWCMYLNLSNHFSKVQRYYFLQVTILIDPKRKDAIDKQIKKFLYSHAGANYAQYSKWSTRPFQHVRFFSFLKCKLTNILCFDKTWSWSYAGSVCVAQTGAHHLSWNSHSQYGHLSSPLPEYSCPEYSCPPSQYSIHFSPSKGDSPDKCV